MLDHDCWSVHVPSLGLLTIVTSTERLGTPSECRLRAGDEDVPAPFELLSAKSG
ncbi:MAG: hypothetical protein KC431_11325 [Myxococcales bacterium]|nr:hypothetical protein [Myxococcales bacterium]